MARNDRKIIVFTGPTGCGKTTIKRSVKEMLGRLNVPFCEIYAKDDLYIPFALEKKLITSASEVAHREEMTKLMTLIYHRYGRDLGTNLVLKYLSNKPKEVIYLLDSKRNPEGIRELQRVIPKLIVIGVTADTEERIQRVLARKKDLDGGQTNQSLFDSFRDEEQAFGVSESLQLCDLLIENHGKLTNAIDVSLANLMIKKGLLAGSSQELLPLLPNGEPGKKQNVLARKMIPETISRFYTESRNTNVVVIQGGNRYISHALLHKFGCKVFDIKITSLTKCRLFLLLNTLLLPKERVVKLDRIIANKIYELYRSSFNKAAEPIPSFDPSALTPDYLAYASRSEILSFFSQFGITLPFTEPSDDKNRSDELHRLNLLLSTEALPSKPLKEVMRLLFSGTDFFENVINNPANISFIDDTIYRGRTIFTIHLLMEILGKPCDEWSFYCLCSDTAVSEVFGSKVQALRENTLYPFENSIITEMGYWEQELNFFSFRDLNDYFRYLCLLAEHKDKKPPSIWGNSLSFAIDKVDTGIFPREFIAAVIVLYVQSELKIIDLNIDCLLDQRAHQIGYNAAFIQAIQYFIAQHLPSTERLKFKEEVRKLISSIRSLHAASDGNLIQNLIIQYEQNWDIIDYKILRSCLGRRKEARKLNPSGR